MSFLTREKYRVLAEKHGWSPEYSEGYVEGESLRRHGKQPPTYPLVGLDQYSEGFRAGYFVRRNARNGTVVSLDRVAPRPLLDRRA